MDPNQDYMRTSRILKTVAGIVSICAGPIALIQAIVLGVMNAAGAFMYSRFVFHGSLFSTIVMCSMLLAGGITMLVGRSKLHGGVAPIVLFAIGTVMGLLGYLRCFMWVWWLWCLLCLAAAIYFRVSNSRILRGEQVYFDPAGVAAEAAGAVRDWAPQAADQAANVVRAAVDIAGDAVHAAQDAARDISHDIRQDVYNRQTQEQYTPQAAQAVQASKEGHTSPFAPEPSPTLAELQKEILARKAGEIVDRTAPAAPTVPAAPAVPAEPVDESAIREAAAAAQEMSRGEGFPVQQ